MLGARSSVPRSRVASSLRLLLLVASLLVLLGAARSDAAAPSLQELLQRGEQGALPVFDLEAAWLAARRGGNSTLLRDLPPRPFPTTALALVPGWQRNAAVTVLRVPEGQWAPAGRVTVEPGTVLVLQGKGGLLDSADDMLPASVLVLPASGGASIITVQPGGVLYVRNLTLVGAAFDTTDIEDALTTWLPTNLVRAQPPPPQQPAPPAQAAPQPSIRVDPEGAEAAVALESCVLVTPSCAALQLLQHRACDMLLRDSDVPWPAVELEPGWLQVFRLQERASNLSTDMALYACALPLPPLAPSGWSGWSVSALNQTQVDPASALYNASMLNLTRMGVPASPPPPLPLGGLNRTSAAAAGGGGLAALPPPTTDGVTPLQCVARRVRSTLDLQRALIQLQPITSKYVFLQVLENMTINSSGPEWPANQLSVRVYRNITIMGRHTQTARVTELNFAQARHIMWIDEEEPVASLRFQQITLNNLPCGPREWFPVSNLAIFIWPVAWNRTFQRSNVHVRLYMTVKNATIVLPEDNYAYQSYWVGIAASPVPQVRQMASWQDEIEFNGTLLVSADSHRLFLQHRFGQGIEWINTTLTDLPLVAPIMNLTCRLSGLVPGQPYYPYRRITPVFTGAQLVAELLRPSQPVVLVLANVTVTRQVAHEAALALQRRHLAPSDNLTASGGGALSEGGGKDNPGAGLLVLDTSATVLGWWRTSTLVDFANQAPIFTLRMPVGQQLTLERLVLGGLGPAGPNQQPARLRNVTSAVWAFDFDRTAQDALALVNVSLLVPPAELAALSNLTAPALRNARAAASGGAPPAPAQSSPPPPPPLPPAPGTPNLAGTSTWMLQARWVAGRPDPSTPDNASTRLDMLRVGFLGVQATDLHLLSTPPADLQALGGNVTPTRTDLLLGDALLITPPGAAGGGGGGGTVEEEQLGFAAWKVGVVVAGACVGLLAALALAALWARRRHRAAARGLADKQRVREEALVIAAITAAAAQHDPSTGGGAAAPHAITVQSLGFDTGHSPASSSTSHPHHQRLTAALQAASAHTALNTLLLAQAHTQQQRVHGAAAGGPVPALPRLRLTSPPVGLQRSGRGLSLPSRLSSTPHTHTPSSGAGASRPPSLATGQQLAGRGPLAAEPQPAEGGAQEPLQERRPPAAAGGRGHKRCTRLSLSVDDAALAAAAARLSLPTHPEGGAGEELRGQPEQQRPPHQATPFAHPQALGSGDLPTPGSAASPSGDSRTGSAGTAAHTLVLGSSLRPLLVRGSGIPAARLPRLQLGLGALPADPSAERLGQRGASPALDSPLPQQPGFAAVDSEIRNLVMAQRQMQQAAQQAGLQRQPPQQQQAHTALLRWHNTGPLAGAGRAAALGAGGLLGGLAPAADGVVLEEVLGQGSFAVVYRGRWRGLTVAVKTLVFHDTGVATRRSRQRAVTETAVNTLLSHECICNMYAYDLRSMSPTGLPDERFSHLFRLYIIQEYCDAGSLSQAIDRGLFLHPSSGERRLEAILEVAGHIARGLEYIHSRHVVHGDLSSDNVLLRTSPGASSLGVQAKVADFGLSRFLDVGPGGKTHVSGARQGTPYYIAPEVLSAGLMSREADTFSLGVILWELFNAHRPPWRQLLQQRGAQQQRGGAQQRSSSAGGEEGAAGEARGADVRGGGGDVAAGAEHGSGPHSPPPGDQSPPQHQALAPQRARRQRPPSLLMARPLLLDRDSLSGLTHPWPEGCPAAYAQLVASCLHPIPKARPRLPDVVASLHQLLESVRAGGEDALHTPSRPGAHLAAWQAPAPVDLEQAPLPAPPPPPPVEEQRAPSGGSSHWRHPLSHASLASASPAPGAPALPPHAPLASAPPTTEQLSAAPSADVAGLPRPLHRLRLPHTSSAAGPAWPPTLLAPPPAPRELPQQPAPQLARGTFVPGSCVELCSVASTSGGALTPVPPTAVALPPVAAPTASGAAAPPSAAGGVLAPWPLGPPSSGLQQQQQQEEEEPTARLLVSVAHGGAVPASEQHPAAGGSALPAGPSWPSADAQAMTELLKRHWEHLEAARQGTAVLWGTAGEGEDEAALAVRGEDAELALARLSEDGAACATLGAGAWPAGSAAGSAGVGRPSGEGGAQLQGAGTASNLATAELFNSVELASDAVALGLNQRS